MALCAHVSKSLIYSERWRLKDGASVRPPQASVSHVSNETGEKVPTAEALRAYGYPPKAGPPL